MTPQAPDSSKPAQQAQSSGRIDIHSHMLPGIDDGCETVEHAVASISMLRQAGYVGSICTPHIWVDVYPANTAEHIEIWTDELSKQLAGRNINYQIWAGGELRLFSGVIDWLKAHGVPTLADSNCVLVDLWEIKWPRWANKAFAWLLAQGYQPILAHPERLDAATKPEQRVHELTDEGVLLQGNFACLTGEEGYLADKLVRQWLNEDRYVFMALDMHRPESLPTRLDGMNMVANEFSQARLDQFTITNPRKFILNH